VRFIHSYCNGSNATESKGPGYETVIRGLCHQLAWNNDKTVAKPASELYNRCKDDRSQSPTMKTWEDLLVTLINSSVAAGPLVFIIDALDECQTRDDWESLLAHLCVLHKQHTGLYFLVLSRPQVTVEKYFADSTRVFHAISPNIVNE
jgi:hypothetical protein